MLLGLLVLAPGAVGAASAPPDPVIGSASGSPWSATVRIGEERAVLTGATSLPTVVDKLAWSSVKALELPVDAGQQSVYLEGVAAYTSSLLADIPGGCSAHVVG